MLFIIFSGSLRRGWEKLQCYRSRGEEPGRGLAQEEGALPGERGSGLLSKRINILLCVPAGDIFPPLVCTQIPCALPRFCRAPVDHLLVLSFCHLASLTQLSLAEVKILMYCLNLEVTFSPRFCKQN